MWPGLSLGSRGQEQIGGHDCQVTKPCTSEGCKEKAILHISTGTGLKFVCWEHIPEDTNVILAMQPIKL